MKLSIFLVICTSYAPGINLILSLCGKSIHFLFASWWNALGHQQRALEWHCMRMLLFWVQHRNPTKELLLCRQAMLPLLEATWDQLQPTYICWPFLQTKPACLSLQQWQTTSTDAATKCLLNGCVWGRHVFFKRWSESQSWGTLVLSLSTLGLFFFFFLLVLYFL
jgi:hypothetical protein